jgi:hypothetical protein
MSDFGDTTDPQLDVHDRLIDARLNGHSWDDIQSHMAAHYDNGGTREQLGFASTEGLMARLDAQHSQNMQIASSTRDEGVGTLTTLAEHGAVGQPAKQPFTKFDTSAEPATEPVIGPAATPTEQRAIENMEAPAERSYSASRDRDI